MRLLNTSTLKLQAFSEDATPEYAILSHLWGPDEILYDEYLSGGIHNGAGYQEIVDLCNVARAGVELAFWSSQQYKIFGQPPLGSALRAFEWVWIDTICIDKSSSAELSEAINSMYRWYKNADVCLVFLPDVAAYDSLTVRSHADDQDSIVEEGHSAFRRQDFIQSMWFTRGWTVQELLAPEYVLSYDIKLRTLGWKHHTSILTAISEACHISESVLRRSTKIQDCCVAQKIAWVAQRHTARAEDLAYCLLGLCDVNMPLLYGEGLRKAFQRLQLEINASSTDDSIFAFSSRNQSAGMLAEHPSYFAGTPLQGPVDRSASYKRRLFTRSPRGIEFDLRIPRGLRPLRHVSWSAPLILSDVCTPDAVYYVRMDMWMQQANAYGDGCITALRSGMNMVERKKDDWLRQLWRNELNKRYFRGRIGDFGDSARRMIYKCYPAKTIRVCVPLQA